MNPKAIIIIGPPAVGKYTIGKMLSEKCKYRFLHEHQLLDIASALFAENSFERTTYYFKLRLDIFSDFIKYNRANLSIVTTFVHLFDNDYYNNSMKSFLNIFQKSNYDTCVVELTASYEERIKRNINEDRLKAKPTKQNVEESVKRMNAIEKNARANSTENDILLVNHRHEVIDTELLSHDEVVEKIMNLL
ncbi:MAG: AAA family ATPase [Bacteroidales bacterium]|jgi:cytidylate kinase|nr:AAA family ATPase [Bacteroidales bacterium]